MGHGEQGRNNNCFNCHDETNLELLQTRDGRVVKFQDSPQLCGSCHGPTYEDWEAGAPRPDQRLLGPELGPISGSPVWIAIILIRPIFRPGNLRPGPHRPPFAVPTGAANIN